VSDDGKYCVFKDCDESEIVTVDGQCKSCPEGFESKSLYFCEKIKNGGKKRLLKSLVENSIG